MVYAVSEPYLPEICHEGLPLYAVVPDGAVLQDVFEQVAYLQVVLAVLVPQYVPAVKRSLCQMVCIQFVPERQGFESRNLVAKQFDIGKAYLHYFFLFLSSAMLSRYSMGVMLFMRKNAA